MKTISNRRKTFIVLLATVIMSSSFLLTACDKDADDIDDNNVAALSGNASGSQEVPMNGSLGTGTLSGSYNKSTNVLQYSISWTGLTGTVTDMHFHGPAPVGISADVLVGLSITSSGATGNGSGTITVSDAFEAQLLTGQVYYNIHTAQFPAGEIRGQVSATVSN